MDQITFHHDTVLSDVHMLLPNARHLVTRFNHAGQPAFLQSVRDPHDDQLSKLNCHLFFICGSEGKSQDGCQHTLEYEPKFFISRFKILSDIERHDTKDPGKSLEEEKRYKDPWQDWQKETNDSQKKVGEEGRSGDVEPYLDEDGDLDITHRPSKYNRKGSGRDLVCPIILKQSNPVLERGEDKANNEVDKCSKDIIRIEHTMATPLEDVGKQVWRGAFLLADFILSERDMFSGATVLELGAGTGLTSIVMATTAKTVYCTDVGEDLLSMCKRNVILNKHMTEPAGGDVRVRQLDWLQHSLCTDTDMKFSWTEEEVADMYDNTGFIIAADVCYDDDLTDGLFRTLYRLCSNFTHTCTILISIEKRMNFTLRHMDVSCEAYNHFSHCLSQLKELVDGRCTFRVEQLPSNFAQFLLYERIEQLNKAVALGCQIESGREKTEDVMLRRLERRCQECFVPQENNEDVRFPQKKSAVKFRIFKLLYEGGGQSES